MALILQLDVNGQPNKWITWQDAAVYHAKELVAWSLGDNETVLRGRTSRLTGEQSIIRTTSIIAVKGQSLGGKKFKKEPSLNNRELFRRDRHICAYCGGRFKESELTRDHIIPRSKGGQDIWMNVVTCCTKCNQKKDDLSLKEAGMQLLYLPYIPCRAEHLILANRHVLQDQMEFLLNFVGDKSRIKLEFLKGSHD